MKKTVSLIAVFGCVLLFNACASPQKVKSNQQADVMPVNGKGGCCCCCMMMQNTGCPMMQMQPGATPQSPAAVPGQAVQTAPVNAAPAAQPAVSTPAAAATETVPANTPAAAVPAVSDDVKSTQNTATPAQPAAAPAKKSADNW